MFSKIEIIRETKGWSLEWKSKGNARRLAALVWTMQSEVRVLGWGLVSCNLLTAHQNSTSSQTKL